MQHRPDTALNYIMYRFPIVDRHASCPPPCPCAECRATSGFAAVTTTTSSSCIRSTTALRGTCDGLLTPAIVLPGSAGGASDDKGQSGLFRCGICARVFNRKFNLKRHAAIHMRRGHHSDPMPAAASHSNYVYVLHS